MSGHRLKIETGRYGIKSNSRLHRICDFCSNTPTMDLLLNLPDVDPIMEDEEHFIRTCPRYHLSRTNIKEPTKSLIFHDIKSLFLEEHIEEFARYLSLIFKTRFQKGPRRRSWDQDRTRRTPTSAYRKENSDGRTHDCQDHFHTDCLPARSRFSFFVCISKRKLYNWFCFALNLIRGRLLHCPPGCFVGEGRLTRWFDFSVVLEQKFTAQDWFWMMAYLNSLLEWSDIAFVIRSLISNFFLISNFYFMFQKLFYSLHRLSYMFMLLSRQWLQSISIKITWTTA